MILIILLLSLLMVMTMQLVATNAQTMLTEVWKNKDRLQ